MALGSVFLLVATGPFHLRPTQAFVALAVTLGLIAVAVRVPGLCRDSA
jgi:hypothetical protein